MPGKKVCFIGQYRPEIGRVACSAHAWDTCKVPKNLTDDVLLTSRFYETATGKYLIHDPTPSAKELYEATKKYFQRSSKSTPSGAAASINRGFSGRIRVRHNSKTKEDTWTFSQPKVLGKAENQAIICKEGGALDFPVLRPATGEDAEAVLKEYSFYRNLDFQTYFMFKPVFELMGA